MLRLLNKRKKRGFTLVEVIIVLVILAILAAVLIPSLSGYIDKANKSKYMLSAKNCMKAMQIELSEAYAEGGAVNALPNIAGQLASYNDVSFIGTDFAKEVLKTADDDPYMLIFGLGDYNTYKDTDPTRCYSVYFVAYWSEKDRKPIYFDGSEWTDKDPWVTHNLSRGDNRFPVNGETVTLQFYFITAPNKTNMSDNWIKLRS